MDHVVCGVCPMVTSAFRRGASSAAGKGEYISRIELEVTSAFRRGASSAVNSEGQLLLVKAARHQCLSAWSFFSWQHENHPSINRARRVTSAFRRGASSADGELFAHQQNGNCVTSAFRRGASSAVNNYDKNINSL